MSEICTKITPQQAKSKYNVELEDTLKICGKDALKKDDIQSILKAFSALSKAEEKVDYAEKTLDNMSYLTPDQKKKDPNCQEASRILRQFKNAKREFEKQKNSTGLNISVIKKKQQDYDLD